MTRPDPGPAGPLCEPTSPSWPPEPCPLWCTRTHADDSRDRYHQSTPSLVPIIATSHRTMPPTMSLEAIDLSIRLGRHAGELVDWMMIESLDRVLPRLVLTTESAWTLSEHLRDQLTRHTR